MGRVEAIHTIPGADLVRRAIVSLGDRDLQVVFGGDRIVDPYCLVPVAPPGTRVARRGVHRAVKMRTRRYRRTVSQGMLCSLEELGWVDVGPNEVVVLRKGVPGAELPLHADLEEWLSDESFSRYADHVMRGYPGLQKLDVVRAESAVATDPRVPS